MIFIPEIISGLKFKKLKLLFYGIHHHPYFNSFFYFV